MSAYEKQELLDNFGPEGQAALQRSHVLIVGLGGLGCACAQQLVAMGVGQITLVDGDQVSVSNLSRQVLYRSKDVGKNKVDAALIYLSALRPECRIKAVASFLDAALCETLFSQVDIIVDASDNFETKFLVNAAGVRFEKPVIWANAQKWEGQIASFDARRGACYQCLLPRLPQSAAQGACNEVGVLGAVPNIVGIYQALESVKALCEFHGVAHVPRVSWGEVLSLSFRDMSFLKTRIAKNTACPVCSKSLDKIVLPKVSVAVCSPGVSIAEIRSHLEKWILVDVREPEETKLGAVPEAFLLPLSKLQTDAGRAFEEMLKKFKISERESPSFAFFCQSGKRSQEALKIFQNTLKTRALRACVLLESAQDLSAQTNLCEGLAH